MATGVKIWNDWGTVQITAEEPVLTLRQKLNVPMALQPGGYYFGQLLLSNYTAPLVAIRCDSNCWLQAINLRINPALFTFRTNANAGVTAYCFDRIMPSQIEANYGLKVWDAAGNLCFGIGAKYARVIEASSGNMSIPQPSGKQYAVAMPTPWLAVRYSLLDDPPRRIVQRSYAPSARTGGNASFAADSQFASLTTTTNDPLPPDYQSRNDTTGIILDVTGY